MIGAAATLAYDRTTDRLSATGRARARARAAGWRWLAAADTVEV